jgi:hypothetical protein
MKYLILLSCCLTGFRSFSQNLQLVYDLRHSTDPKNNPKNYPTLYFEYFKSQDSGRAFIKPGSFLFKMQADATGPGTNTSKMYFQVAQTLRFWEPKVFLHLSISGGLGVTEPKQYSYYILTNYEAGVAWPFRWKGGFYSLVLDYRYVPYSKPTSDLIWTFYFYRAFFNYRLELLGDLNAWTENKNHGDDYTATLSGKQFFFYAEPQIWYRFAGSFSAGIRMNIYYHVNTPSNRWEVYPAAGIRWKL